jgi:hypothetical protein
MDVATIFTNACTEMGIDESLSSIYWENVNTSFTTANNFKVFDDPDNLINMERGESPIIADSNWKGEKLALLPIVPPLLEPEVAKSLANLVLVPEIVRNATPQTVTAAAVERSYLLMNHHLATRESHDRVVAAKQSEKN